MRAPAAEFHLEMDLVAADMDRRALVPLAVMPAIACAGDEVAQLVVTVVGPHDHLAAGQPYMREIAGIVDGRLVVAIEPVDIVVHHLHGRGECVPAHLCLPLIADHPPA